VNVWVGWGITCVIVLWIGMSTVTGYFYDYAVGLPHKNTLFSREIASIIDLHPTSAIYLPSCCFSAMGTPDPETIGYSLRDQKISRIIEGWSDPFDCRLIQNATSSALFILSPHDSTRSSEIQQCMDATDQLRIEVLRSSNTIYYQILTVFPRGMFF
jgi:hypothetical protein